ncbi:MAG: Rhodanese-related sulfurtransferase, partial [uncultured Quadrisphaera sp.]
ERRRGAHRRPHPGGGVAPARRRPAGRAGRRAHPPGVDLRRGARPARAGQARGAGGVEQLPRRAQRRLPRRAGRGAHRRAGALPVPLRGPLGGCGGRRPRRRVGADLQRAGGLRGRPRRRGAPGRAGLARPRPALAPVV